LENFQDETKFIFKSYSKLADNDNTKEGRIMNRVSFHKILTVLIICAPIVASFISGRVTADQPHMHSALDYLRAARDQLEQASHDKGGHRVKAINLVSEAIREVKAGIEASRNY